VVEGLAIRNFAAWKPSFVVSGEANEVLFPAPARALVDDLVDEMFFFAVFVKYGMGFIRFPAGREFLVVVCYVGFNFRCVKHRESPGLVGELECIGRELSVLVEDLEWSVEPRHVFRDAAALRRHVYPVAVSSRQFAEVADIEIVVGSSRLVCLFSLVDLCSQEVVLRFCDVEG
jgi:hypothetical protein